MSRASVVLTLFVLLASLLACEREAAAPVGAIRVHTAIGDAVLFIDAHEYGPLRDSTVIELPVGQHTLEARRLGTMLAFLSVDVRAALIFDATLAVPSPPALEHPSDVVVPSALPPPPEPPAPVSAEPVPESSPSRAEIVAALQGLRPGVLACTRGTHGTFTLRVSFAASGVPNTVTVSGGDLLPDQRPCIVEVAQALRISPFEPRDFIVNYPYTY